MRTWVRLGGALCLGALVHGAGSCVHPASARAQEPADCEPLTASSLRLVGEQLGFGDDQLDWLAERLAAGRLRSPEDVDDLPGAGAARKEDLAAAFCWGRAGRGESLVTGRGDSGGIRREARARIATGGFEASGRARWDPDDPARLRGGVSWRGGAWRIQGGALRARRSLGLLVATPGAEPRGTGPIAPARSGWGTTQSLDPDVLQGVSVDGAAGAHHGEVALVHGRVTGEDGERAPAWWGTAAWERTTGFGRWGAALVRSGGRWAGGASVDATIGPGTWSTEWSRAAAGYAAGTAVSLAAGSVRVRGELSHVGAGYRIPGIRQVRDARGVESVRYGVEGRWQRERGRFLRLLVHGEREPAAGDAPWPRTAGVQEVELGERLRARLHLGLLWRLTIRNADAVDTQDQLVRSDLIYRGRGWRVRFRVERKAAGEAYALASLRAGWTGRIPWEVAIDRVSGTGAVPWVHRRRAGVLYGWDRMAAGTWIGGWIRIPASRWEGELSVYGRHTGWDLALALRMAFGLP